MSNIKCPYCLEGINKSSVIYECPSCGKRYSAGGLFKNQTPMCSNKVVHASTIPASRILCNNKGCGNILPADFLDYAQTLKFSLVGTTNSGKTNFLITMLHELMHNLKTGLSLSTLDATSQTYAEFKEFERIMYEDHSLLPATDRGIVDPYLWRIRDRNKAKGNQIPSYSLTIYDGAGENFSNIDKAENTILSRYLCDTNTLFILIDPLQLSSFKKQGIGGESVDFSNLEGQDASESLDKVVSYLRTNKGLGANQLIDMNIAIIFTKIDALVDDDGVLQFGDGDLILRRSTASHFGCFDFRRNGFDMKEAGVISDSIRDFIMERESRFYNILESNFIAKKIQYFAVSALGNPPIKENGNITIQHIDPIRVLDPFLWMMMKEGFIKELK